MNEQFEEKREKMWEQVLSLTEEYTADLLSNEDMSDDDLNLNLSAGFDVLSGVLSEWVAAINLDVMTLTREQHETFITNMLEVVKEDMIASFDDLSHEDDLEDLYDSAEEIVNPEDLEEGTS